MAFQIEDTYFTKTSTAQDKIKWINIGLACANAVVIASTVCKMPPVAHMSRCGFVRSWLRTRGFWANVFSIGPQIINFFILIPQWNYICNQFFFTFDQAHGFMLFFAAGAVWAALGADLTLGSLHQMLGHKSAIWLPLFSYLVFMGTFLVTVEFAANVWLTRFLCLLMGATQFTCLIGSF